MPKKLTPKKLTLALLREFIQRYGRTPFGRKDIIDDFPLKQVSNKDSLGSLLQELVNKSEIERLGRGIYRLIEAEVEEIDLGKVDVTKEFPLKMPFGIEEYVVIFPDSVAVIAGVTNSGKSAFMFNLIKLNMDWHDVWYFFSEGGGEQLKDRLLSFGMPIEDWHFHAVPRTTDFVKVIRPDALNIIDFLAIEDEFWAIDRVYKHIIEKLNNGVCFIALQKNRSTKFQKVDYAPGGHFSKDRASLFLLLDPGVLEIDKAKKWRGIENPNHLKFQFKLIGGHEFTNITRVYPKQEEWEK